VFFFFFKKQTMYWIPKQITFSNTLGSGLMFKVSLESSEALLAQI